MLHESPLDTIIIAENDSLMRSLLRSILARPERELRLAKDGDEAVEIAEAEHACLVLLDLRMPRMDGITACRMIRALPNYQGIPVIILTGVPSEHDQEAAKRAGANGFWKKPIAIDQLQRGLEPLIAAGKLVVARCRLAQPSEPL
jgi:two-component system sensor histidine kinase/response regulator